MGPQPSPTVLRPRPAPTTTAATLLTARGETPATDPSPLTAPARLTSSFAALVLSTRGTSGGPAMPSPPQIPTTVTSPKPTPSSSTPPAPTPSPRQTTTTLLALHHTKRTPSAA